MINRAISIFKETSFKIDPATKCWIWPKSTNMPNGYGRIMLRDKDRKNIGFLAHRVSYVVYKGKIPKGMDVLHKCDNRLCSNPKHLFLGNDKLNARDKVMKGRHPGGGGRSRKYDYDKINQRILSGFSCLDIAREIGADVRTIYKIRRKISAKP